MKIHECGPGTIAAWGGEERPAAFGAVQVPIVQSAPFGYPDVDTWLKAARGDSDGHLYSRHSNPTVAVFEEKLRLLEGAEAATAFASGMAAISDTLFALARPGDRIVALAECYGGTSRLFLEFLPAFGIEVELVRAGEDDALQRAVAHGCRLLYLETPTNPTLRIVDLRRACTAARRQDAVSIVDNTLASPINQSPIALGADLVLHSATKFLGGHDDAIGGVLAGRAGLVGRVRRYREINGASLGAFQAYLLLRGLKTLELRIARQNANAMAMARFLSGHPSVAEVCYPGLESHPGHAIANRQMRGYGGVLSFSLHGDFAATCRVVDALRLAHRAASLGSVNTLAGPPCATSHVECSAEERMQLGIPESMVRYSCGIENFDDLRDDMAAALER